MKKGKSILSILSLDNSFISLCFSSENKGIDGDWKNTSNSERVRSRRKLARGCGGVSATVVAAQNGRERGGEKLRS